MYKSQKRLLAKDKSRHKIIRFLKMTEMNCLNQPVNVCPQVYKTRKLGNQLAVDKLCIGVPEGEVCRSVNYQAQHIYV